MKKHGILNAKLAAEIAALGHKDCFMIGDAGMPIPKDVQLIDLALCGGVPTFEQVMYTIAEEINQKNPRLLEYIRKSLPDAEEKMILHIELKEMSKSVKFAIRTGEFTPFPNIILRAGVAFEA